MIGYRVNVRRSFRKRGGLPGAGVTVYQDEWRDEPSIRRLLALPDIAAAATLLVATALLTALSVLLRVAASADEPTLAASLAAIAENRAPYLAGGATRFASGAALLLGAWFLGRAGMAPGRGAPTLFALSGLLTLLSGACALLLGAAFAGVDPAGGDALARWAAPVDGARWLTGSGGFAAAGLALVAIAAGQRRWPAGPLLLAATTGAVGVAMQLIWLEAATGVHRVSGVAFLLWLAVSGVGLLVGWGPWRVAGSSAE